MVWPAYTSLGHGQNFVQKDWVNGISPHGPDEEGIGSTIIIFHHKINVVHPLWWLQGGLQRWGVSRSACGGTHEEGSTLVWCLWEALQKKGVPRSSCGAVHEGSLLKCDVCGKRFRRREFLGSIWCCSRRGFFSSVMFGGNGAEVGTTLRDI